MTFNLKSIITTVTTSTLLLTSFSSLAQEESLVVTANRIEQNIEDTITDIEIIEREDIERLQPQSFTDLLTNIAGIDTTRKGGPGQDASIFSRGTNSNQLLVLVDGIRVGSATLGGKSVASIAIAQIERIEIVKGPRAALWGSDAIGGVIQIFTRRNNPGEHRVALTAGSNATVGLDASVGFGTANFNNTLTYSHKQSDGFDAHIDAETDDDGHESDSLSIRGDYRFNDAKVLDWVLQADSGETEFDTSWGGNILEYNNQLWSIRYTQQTDSWNNQFSASSSRDQNFSFGNGVEKANADIFETRRQQYKYLTHKNINNALAVSGGIEWIEDAVDKSTTQYSQSKRTTKSAHINANYVDETLLAEFAARYDDVENIADDTSLNLGLGYRFNSNNQLSINFGQGFKAPTFNDLYFPWGGNPDLKFETSENTELVYKGSFDSSRLVISIYDSEVDYLIQWIPDSDGVWTPQNIGAADISGVDARFTFSYGNVDHKIMASHTDATDAATGSQLMLRAKKQMGYEFSYSADAFSLFTQVQYVGERPDTDYLTWMPTMLSSYTQVNFGASYNVNGQWQVNLKVSDLFDESPTQVSGYNSGGREFYITLVHRN